MIVELRCESILGPTDVTVQGGLVCEIGPTNELTRWFMLTCKQSEGMNEYTHYWDPGNCNEVPDFLESEGEGLNGWPMQQSSLVPNPPSGEQEIETSQNIEIEAAEC